MTDIEGSTDLQSRLGDVKARELMRDHETIVRDALAEHGGREVKTMGDGFLVTFTSTRRALECAIDIQRQTATSDLSVRIGVHCGELIHEGDDIHGAAVAAAARIVAQARGGEIVVSDLARQLAGTAGIQFRERGKVTLKGLDGPWLLHDVHWGDEATPAPRASSTSTPGIIGREAESTILDDAVDDAIAGRGRLVLLAGEPGIGKTTLAVSATDHATKQGARILWGACWEGEGAPAFWPWIQAIRAYAAERTDDELAVDAGAGTAELCRLLPEFATRLPETPAPPDVDAEQARFRLFDALATFICRAAARQPLMIVLDDLHWADESSMRLLNFVAGQLATTAVVIVGTYRDTEVGPDHPLAALMHDATRRGHLVPVRGLDAGDVARLMASTAGTELRVELSAAVHQQTAGNPLFVGEVTRLLAAQNALDRSEVAVGVPQGVREVIERRMARLPQRCIEALTLAAVAGEEFRLDVVGRAAVLSPPALIELLEPAVTAGAACATTVGRYRFAHALFREALYEGQGVVARAGLHLQIANALEERYQEAGDVDTAELAHHFNHAALTGDTDRAVRYARAAAAEATASVAYEEAIGHLERALQTLDLAPHPTESLRAEVLLDLSGARWRAGDRDGALAEVHRSIALARRTQRTDVLARAALGLHRLGGTSGIEDSEAFRLLEEANAGLQGEETPLRARVMAALAKERYHSWAGVEVTGADEELAAEAVAMARRLGDGDVLIEALAAHHDVIWFTGKEKERLEVATELRHAAAAAGDQEQSAEAILLQAVAMLEMGNPEALPMLEEFISQAENLRNPRFAYLAATRRVTLALIRGDVAEAHRALQQAEDIATEHGEPDHLNVSAAQLLAVKTFEGRRSEAVDRARFAYATNKAYSDMIQATEALGFMDQGRVDDARAKLLEVDVLRPQRPFKNYGWLYETAILAEAAATIGEPSMVDTLAEQLEPFHDRCVLVAGAVCFTGSVAHYLGLLARAQGRDDAAAAYFADAIAAHERVGAPAWVARTKQAMGAGPAGAGASEMRRAGTTWTLVHDGASASVRDSKGVRDLAILLAAPNREVAAADLIAQGEATASGADSVLDDRARREFRARLTELDVDLGEAEATNDLERISRIKDERDALAHELAAAMGLGGRDRKLGDPAERARKAVAARVRDAIEKIAAVHPDLGQHLRASVQTGTFCVYAPPSPTVWRVTNDTAR